MPPRSRRQNSVVNSHPDTESNAQNRAVGGMQQNNGGNMEGGGIPEGNPGGGNPGGQPPLTLIYELIQSLQQNQGELAESIRQLKESSNNREAHGGNGRNHEERDHHDERDSNNKNDTPFVTMSDVADLLKQERERPPKEPRHLEVQSSISVSFWILWVPSQEMEDSACGSSQSLLLTEHIPGMPCCPKDLLEIGKTWWKASVYEESELVEVCIDNMFPEFRAHLENLDISQFAPLLQKARKTALSVKPHSEKAREKKSQHQALTVSTTTAPSGNKRKRPVEKIFEEPPPLPFTVEEMMVIFDKWVKDEVIKLPQINKPPTEEEKRDPKFCRYHRYVHHPTADCRSLRWELNRKIQDGTLQLSPEQQKVHKNPFPNHRKDQGKAVVFMVIQGSTSDMEVDESAVADTTLTPAAARNAATEAIIAIAANSGATCFTTKAHASRAFLETTNAVTFMDEDMEVQYPDHRRPLYVSAVIKDVQVRRALVDTGSCLNLIPLSTLKAANIPQHKIQGAPIEVTGFGGAAEYTMGHIQLVLRVGPIVALTRFHVCIKGRLNGKPIRIAANPSPFDQTKSHFIEAALYDELPTEEPPIIKPSGTPLPDWEDIKNDLDVDLRKSWSKEAEGHEKLAVEKEEVKLEKSAEVDKKIIPKEDLEVINLSHDPGIDKPVSISTSLSAVRATTFNPM
uniref:Peptidase A2 domain-containing protein n=1 Tax=Fagus sylvatica TaxID=28930 RepID=A0A2N9EDP8_FAGSY